MDIFRLVPLWAWPILLAIGMMLILLLIERCRARRFSSRESLSLEAWYDTYYAASGIPRETVSAVLSALALDMGTQPGRLRPTDRLSKQYATFLTGTGFDSHLELAEEDISAFVERETGHPLATIRYWATLDDVIRGAHSVIQHRARLLDSQRPSGPQ